MESPTININQPLVNPQSAVVPMPPPRRNKNLFKLLVIVPVIIVVATAVFYLFFMKKASNNIDPTTQKIAYWQQIVPSQTNKAEVIDKLGQPQSSKKDGDKERLEFPSSVKTFANSVTIDDKTGKVTSVFNVVDQTKKENLDQYLKDLGQPEKAMYSNYMQGVRTYIWPKKGLAIWADEKGNTIFIRSFESTDIDNFIKLYGRGLFESDPYLY